MPWPKSSTLRPRYGASCVGESPDLVTIYPRMVLAQEGCHERFVELMLLAAGDWSDDFRAKGVTSSHRLGQLDGLLRMNGAPQEATTLAFGARRLSVVTVGSRKSYDMLRAFRV